MNQRYHLNVVIYECLRVILPRLRPQELHRLRLVGEHFFEHFCVGLGHPHTTAASTRAATAAGHTTALAAHSSAFGTHRTRRAQSRPQGITDSKLLFPFACGIEPDRAPLHDDLRLGAPIAYKESNVQVLFIVLKADGELLILEVDRISGPLGVGPVNVDFLGAPVAFELDRPAASGYEEGRAQERQAAEDPRERGKALLEGGDSSRVQSREEWPR